MDQLLENPAVVETEDSTRSLLIVGDDSAAVTLLRSTLKGDDHEVKAATSALSDKG